MRKRVVLVSSVSFRVRGALSFLWLASSNHLDVIWGRLIGLLGGGEDGEGEGMDEWVEERRVVN